MTYADEAHLLSAEKLELLLECVKEQPVIFSSDVEDMISSKEIDRRGTHRIERLPEIQIFRLTNRIRANAEVSSFIQNMMHSIIMTKKGILDQTSREEKKCLMSENFFIT